MYKEIDAMNQDLKREEKEGKGKAADSSVSKHFFSRPSRKDLQTDFLNDWRLQSSWIT